MAATNHKVVKENGLEVYKSINKVTADLTQFGIQKLSRNTDQGWDFRGIDDVYNVLAGLLSTHGLVIYPKKVKVISTEERPTNNGGLKFLTTVKVLFRIVSSIDGSSIECQKLGKAMDTSDKDTNKAETAAFKYLCFQTFCIPTVGSANNDADFETNNVVSEQPAPADLPADQFIDEKEFRELEMMMKDVSETFRISYLGLLGKRYKALDSVFPDESQWLEIPSSHVPAIIEKIDQTAAKAQEAERETKSGNIDNDGSHEPETKMEAA